VLLEDPFFSDRWLTEVCPDLMSGGILGWAGKRWARLWSSSPVSIASHFVSKLPVVFWLFGTPTRFRGASTTGSEAISANA